jgi:serine/threonine protein kinase
MSSDAFPIPFGRYQLVERLAIGGMAELFKARVVGAHGFQKAVVIKKILPHLAADASFVAMFIDEANITARLQHPKIAQVLELGTIDDQLYIAMEYVEGLDALAILRACAARKHPLPSTIAVHICHEVLDALDYAHNARDDKGRPIGIVHRDISPSNVLISRRGDVKLADFGIAHAVERQQQTQTGTLKGKYGYMSPEQVIGGELDARSDLFSVGIVMSEMLMGRRLFTAANELDVLLQVRDVKLDRLDRYGANIEPDLRAILMRALQRDPKERHQSAAAFRDTLADWLFSKRVRVTPSDLAAFVDSLYPSDGPRPQEAAAPAAESGARPRPPMGTLVGPATKAKELRAAEVAKAAKHSIARDQTAPAVPEPDVKSTPSSAPSSPPSGVGTPQAPLGSQPPLGPQPPQRAHPRATTALESPRRAPTGSAPAAAPPVAPASPSSGPKSNPAGHVAPMAAKPAAAPAAAPATPKSPALAPPPSDARVSADLPVFVVEDELSGPVITIEPPKVEHGAHAGRGAYGPQAPHALAKALDVREPVASKQSVAEADFSDLAALFSGDSAAGTAPRISQAEADAKPRPSLPSVGGQADLPDEEGDFTNVPPIRILYKLAVEKLSGLLVVEISAIAKEIYFAQGVPEFVSSNVARELLGEYLLAQKIISQGELAMALAMMPHFGGKLGDTLVGLGLMKPLDVFRHLTRQVRDKIVDVCTWQKGHYRWYRGKRNPRESFPLGLDAFEVLGAGATALPVEAVEAWIKPLGERSPIAAKNTRVVPEAFRLGTYPRDVYNRLDGKHKVKEWLGLFTVDSDRLAFLRTLYLLINSDLAYWA